MSDDPRRTGFCTPDCYRECQCSRWPDMLDRWGNPVNHGQGGGPPDNGLLNNLIAYWPGDEINGDLLDLHINTLNLGDVNTVTSNPGLVYPLVRQYTALNGEYHRRLIASALLNLGDTDFTLASWVRLDTLGWYTIVSKWAAGTEEYLLYLNAGVNQFEWIVYNGPIVGSVLAGTFGVVPTGAWHLVVCWHDSVANMVCIQVDDGGVDTAVTTGPPGAFAARLCVGGVDAGALTMDGRIGPTALWKSAGGGGGVLTAAQRTALYNGGAGLTYAALTI